MDVRFTAVYRKVPEGFIAFVEELPGGQHPCGRYSAPAPSGDKMAPKKKGDIMKTTWKGTLGSLAALLVAAAVLAQGGEADKAKSPHKGGAKKFVVWPAADLKWEPLAGAPPGPMIATLWGDPTKGAYGAILKFPPGFSAGLHTHSADLKIVVISGTWIHGEEGKPEVKLGAGSYLFQPSHLRHTTACDKASECVAFFEASGKFDIKMVEEKKALAKM